MIDFQGLNEHALQCSESILTALFPNGKRRGSEFEVGSVSGEAGSSLKVNIHSGMWKDFASDEAGGDICSLVAAVYKCNQAEAAKKLSGMLNLTQESTGEKSDGFSVARGVESDRAPFRAHAREGIPSAVYRYGGKSGECLGYVFRFDSGDKKTFAPLTPWLDEDGSLVWRWKGFSKPRPVYGLDRLEANPGKKVLIVEGEKACDAIVPLFAETVVISWPGGSSGFRSVDWTPLADRSVLIWPDNDKPGIEAANGIADILSNSCSRVRVMPVPEGKPKGWDAADAVAEGVNIASLIASQLQKPVEPEPEPDLVEADKPPFRCLGYDKGNYFYLPNGSKQIVSLTANEHRELQLLQLAPANYWESMFPGKESANWKAAANALIQISHNQGIFTPRKVRGRGAWLDEGRTVYHLGDRLLVDGTLEEVHAFDTRFVYEVSHSTPAPKERPANNAEAAQLIALCELMPWKQGINAKLFAGWLVLAPIAGVLTWRPHIWLNGPSGSGKSWILYNVLLPMLGQSCVNVQSATTEAGIRQLLGSDSIPVVLDEAESEDKAGQLRIQKILELARGASSETGAGIVKGSAGGTAQEFLIRTCFCFSSVGVGATQRSDVSRITNLEVAKTGDSERFAELKSLRSLTAAKPEWCDSVRARALSIAPTIRENAIVFAAAVGAHLGDQRSGDQLGTLLAGAFSLTSVNKVTPEFAAEWVAKQDWTTWAMADIDKDEYRALSVLCCHLIKVDGELNQTFSVSELIQGAMTGNNVFEDVLLRHGIKLTETNVAISNSHSSLSRVFRETPWAGKWKDQFLRVEGAASGRERFNGIQQRCCFIPFGIFERD